jgi:hypothetical protein
MADDKRWMIRGVDREIRKAVKNAANAEGIGLGTWVRRSLVRSLDVASKGPATVTDLAERMRQLEARLSVLERSHRALHQKVDVGVRPAAKVRNQKQASWKRTRKSK